MTSSSHSWKALILAAGYGTRLLPYTRNLPKPLFTINNVPLLDIIIQQVAAAGCDGVVINTHHLSEKIEHHCSNRQYDIPVRLSYEPKILGTGGAMKNNADFFGGLPFLVINADILTDIDLAAAYRFHAEHDYDVTLVMHDCERFNSVAVDRNNDVVRFYRNADKSSSQENLLAFTGIHVIHPRILKNIPESDVCSDIIDVYSNMLSRGETITTRIVEGHQWEDIGTPEAYQAIAFKEMSQRALQTAFGETTVDAVEPITSDGSDTRWYRILSPRGSIIACERGLNTTDPVSEAESFTRINRHLFDNGLAVPEMHLSDPLAGMAFMEDLGDTSLQTTVHSINEIDGILQIYRLVIYQLLNLALTGIDGFDDSWTYQTPSYDRQVILDRECRYFKEAFLEGYLGMDTSHLKLEDDFHLLSDLTLRYGINGLMHRDMQSRNIMICNGLPYFIDFQGARRGPVQYDLASLLIDPYVSLSPDIQKQLLDEYETGLSAQKEIDGADFHKGYACCTVTRNLQILGAFGFLTRQKQKIQFEPHIPAAARSLVLNTRIAETLTGEKFPELVSTADRALEAVSLLF